MEQVMAKTNFYHDMTGSKAMGEVFEVDQDTLQTLETAGYVKKIDAHEFQKAQAEIQQRQTEMGKQQAMANEVVSVAAHLENQMANQHTQQMNQEMQQQSQQRGANYTNQADQMAQQQAERQFQPTAMPNVEANPQAAQQQAKARKADK